MKLRIFLALTLTTALALATPQGKGHAKGHQKGDDSAAPKARMFASSWITTIPPVDFHPDSQNEVAICLPAWKNSCAETVRCHRGCRRSLLRSRRISK